MWILLEPGDVIREGDEFLNSVSSGGSRGGWHVLRTTAEAVNAIGHKFNPIRHPPCFRKLSAGVVKTLREIGEI